MMSPSDSEPRTAPGPRGDFLLGSTLDFKESPLEFISYLHRAYGDVVRFRVGPSHWYLVSHPEDIWDMMVHRSKIFLKPAVARRLWEKFLGDGLLTVEGDRWKRLHSLMRPAFHKRRVSAYGATMVDYTHRMVDGWAEGESVDFNEAMVGLTLEVVAKTLFNADVRAGTGTVAQAMDTLNVEMLNHIHMPIPVPRWWPSERNRRKMAAIEDIEKIVRGVIAERRSPGEDHGDLLSMLVDARSEDGDGLTDAELRDQAMTLFWAGHGTTAHAMTWTWYLLARHPAITERLRADIQEVTGGGRLEVEHLSQLPYLDQVIKESMRLYPPVYTIGRQLREDFELGGYTFSKGDTLLFVQWVTHRSAKCFADPLYFDPDRWL
ncbi:MAG: cytochrome P450, partial [Actinomycetia bacterium]|nr:cytochrome P450 [Actinomycetes bacterium]